MPPQVEDVITKPSTVTVEILLEHLQETIQQQDLTIFAHINHSEEASRVGLEMQEAHVLILGNPKAGTPLMIASPLLASELPLKVLILQSQDARIWVSSTSVAYLSERFALPQEFVGNLAVVDTNMQQALQG